MTAINLIGLNNNNMNEEITKDAERFVWMASHFTSINLNFGLGRSKMEFIDNSGAYKMVEHTDECFELHDIEVLRILVDKAKNTK
jgi:hypothetical protein